MYLCHHHCNTSSIFCDVIALDVILLEGFGVRSSTGSFSVLVAFASLRQMEDVVSIFCLLYVRLSYTGRTDLSAVRPKSNKVAIITRSSDSTMIDADW